MVCLACLLPLFLIPVVNALPVVSHSHGGLARIYRLLGWEYRAPERVPPACPYKPGTSNKSNNSGVNGEADEPLTKDQNSKPVELDSRKTD
ncbi:Leiomodin-1 [Bienertia sinuspersici]